MQFISFHDFHFRARHFFDGFGEIVFRITAVNKEFQNSGKRIQIEGNHLFRSGSVSNICGGYKKRMGQSERIRDDMQFDS